MQVLIHVERFSTATIQSARHPVYQLVYSYRISAQDIYVCVPSHCTEDGTYAPCPVALVSGPHGARHYGPRMAESPPDLVTAIKWHAENSMCILYVAQVHNKRSEKLSALSVA